MPTVSLTMIVRDEERNLPDCLASCAELFDELVIVDTGSTDRTKAVAAAGRDRHGRPARVFDFVWCDDFAAARNESLRHATGDWIFWMDADDRLDDVNRGKLAELLASLDDRYQGYELGQVSMYPSGEVTLPFRQLRLFPRRPELTWFGRIHEGIRVGPELPRIWTHIEICHVGYRDPTTLFAKSDRNLRLLEMQVAETPDHPIVLFHLAREYFIAGRAAEGYQMLDRLDQLGTDEARTMADDVRERVRSIGGAGSSGQAQVETLNGLPIGGTIIA